MQRLVFLWLAAWLLAGAAAAQGLPAIGVNKFDLFSQYIGTASNCAQTEPCRRVTRAMARKAIEDAADAGIPFLRVSVTGATVDDSDDRNALDLWRRDPARFWAVVDAMMDDLDSRGVRMVPVLMWSGKRFPVMAGETTVDLIANPQSRSWQMLSQFVTGFVNRYKGRNTILFYELTNELNNAADLDHERRCARGNKRLCEFSGNFSTDQMIAFTSRFAALVKGLDPRRPVSSGFSIPRRSAANLRAQPEWSTQGPRWRPDTREQFARYLKDIHRGVDIVSIHLYGGEANARFGAPDFLEVLAEAKRAADEEGKPLFVGEFGEGRPMQAGRDTPTARMIRRMLELKVAYGAVWVWELYQKNTFSTHNTKPSNFSLEPGLTDFVIEELRRANAQTGASATLRKPAGDQPPRVVLTWPLECSALRPGDRAYAVASDDSGRVARVEFWLDDRQLAADSSLPYAAELPQQALAPGVHVLAARAYDAAGQRSESVARVVAGEGRAACR